MCIFSDSKPIFEEGLLTLEQFKLPLPDEDLGGDVIIGWRSWDFIEGGFEGGLRSPYYYATWPHERVMKANGIVSHLTGRGLYVQENLLFVFRRNDVFGRAALFGRVLNFDKPSGAMGEFGYPLDLYTTPNRVGRLLETFGQMGVNIWSSRSIYDPIEMFVKEES